MSKKFDDLLFQAYQLLEKVERVNYDEFLNCQSNIRFAQFDYNKYPRKMTKLLQETIDHMQYLIK